MGTAVEISAELFEKVQKHSLESGRTLTSIVEQGLKMVLDSGLGETQFTLSKLRSGNQTLGDPLDSKLISEILYSD